MVTSFICIHTKVCIYSIKETVCNRAKAGSELPESVAPILQNGGSQSPDRWLKEPRNNQCYEIQPDERLFPYTKSFLNHEMQRGCKKSGVKKIRVHDLRHSHASLLIEMGCQPLLVTNTLP